MNPADFGVLVFQAILAIYAKTILTSVLAIPAPMVGHARMNSTGMLAVARLNSMGQLVSVRKGLRVMIAPKKSMSVTLSLVKTMPPV